MQGVPGLWLIPNIGTFLPKPFRYLPAISIIPGDEENHGPVSPYHRDPGPTSTDLQGGLIPEGSCRVVVFKSKYNMGVAVAVAVAKSWRGKTARGKLRHVEPRLLFHLGPPAALTGLTQKTSGGPGPSVHPAAYGGGEWLA